MGQENGVGLHGAAGPPREGQVGQGRIVCRLARFEFPVRGVVAGSVDAVGSLKQGTSGDGMEDAFPVRVGDGLQQSQVLLRGEDRQSLRVEAGGDHDLGEDVLDLFGQFGGNGAVGGDHPTKRGDRIAGMGPAVGLRDVRTHRDPARIGVFDDRDTRLSEVARSAVGSLAVGVVVVAHGFAVQQLGLGDSLRTGRIGVEGRGLVGVLAVAQVLLLHPGRSQPVREPIPSRGGHGGPHPGGHGDVVGGGVTESLGGEVAALLEGETTLGEGGQDSGVLRCGGDHRDTRVVLRGGTHHRGPADVDLFNAFVDPGTGCDGGLERVEVHRHQVEGSDIEFLQLGDVGG